MAQRVVTLMAMPALVICVFGFVVLGWLPATGAPSASFQAASPVGSPQATAPSLLATVQAKGSATAAAALTASGTVPTPGVVRERLLAEASGYLDNLGSVPLVRLTIAAGAELPAGVLAGPLLAVVETGTFDLRVGHTAGSVGPGDRIVAGWAEIVTARNIGADDGVWLVLALGPADPRPVRFPWDKLEGDAAPPGVALARADAYQDFMDIDTSVRISLDRVTLSRWAVLPSADLGGEMATERVVLVVEAGEVTVPGEPTGSTPGPDSRLRAGDVKTFWAGDASSVRARGGPAEVLLVRVAKEPTPPGAATPAVIAPSSTASATPTGAASTAGGTAIEIDLNDIHFDPHEVTIPANTDVAITVVNVGILDHSFDIDALNLHSGAVAPGQSVTVTINAAPGEYEYDCNVPGHREAGMVGRLTVR